MEQPRRRFSIVVDDHGARQRLIDNDNDGVTIAHAERGGAHDDWTIKSGRVFGHGNVEVSMAAAKDSVTDHVVYRVLHAIGDYLVAQGG